MNHFPSHWVEFLGVVRYLEMFGFLSTLALWFGFDQADPGVIRFYLKCSLFIYHYNNLNFYEFVKCGVCDLKTLEFCCNFFLSLFMGP